MVNGATGNGSANGAGQLQLAPMATAGNGSPPNGSPNGTTSLWSKQVAAASPAAYSPDKFYVVATDVRGHGEHLNVKVPPEVCRQIQMLVESGAFPAYEVSGDFVRDAIHHHLHTRNDHIGDPQIRESLDQLFVMRELEERLARAKRVSMFWKNQMDDWHETFIQLAKDEAWPQLWYFIRDVEDVVESAPEPYRLKLLVMLGEWRQRVPESSRN